MAEYEKIVKDIADKLDALGQRVQPEFIERLVKDKVAEVLASPETAEVVRKMRFPERPEASVENTRWAQLGLGERDLIFARDFILALGRKPSEKLENFYRALPKYHYDVRAMDTSESGYGAQLVGVAYNTSLWEQAVAETRVFGLIPSFQMKAPTEYLPVAAGLPEVMLLSESTTYNASNYTTTKTGSNHVSVAVKKLGFHEMWSGEMEEDSIIPYVPFLRARAEAAIAFYNDSVVINGDTTNAATGNINSDDADPDDTKHYLAFDGLRHVGLVDNAANSANAAGAITLAMLAAAKGRMVDVTYKIDWGHPQKADDLVYVADPETCDKIAQLEDVVTWFQHQNQPLLNGQVAVALGHPVISSMAVPKTEADGKVSATPANNTKGQVVTFNRNGFVVGWWRGVKMEYERIPATDQSRMVYTWRLAFGRYSPTGAASGIECADVIYNITL